MHAGVSMPILLDINALYFCNPRLDSFEGSQSLSPLYMAGWTSTLLCTFSYEFPSVKFLHNIRILLFLSPSQYALYSIFNSFSRVSWEGQLENFPLFLDCRPGLQVYKQTFPKVLYPILLAENDQVPFEDLLPQHAKEWMPVSEALYVFL